MHKRSAAFIMIYHVCLTAVSLLKVFTLQPSGPLLCVLEVTAGPEMTPEQTDFASFQLLEAFFFPPEICSHVSKKEMRLTQDFTVHCEMIHSCSVGVALSSVEDLVCLKRAKTTESLIK